MYRGISTTGAAKCHPPEGFGDTPGMSGSSSGRSSRRSGGAHSGTGGRTVRISVVVEKDLTEAHEGIVSVDVAEELAVGGGRPRGRAVHGLDEVGKPEPAGAVRYLGGVRLVRVVHRDVEIRIQQTRRDGEADDARADDRGAGSVPGRGRDDRRVASRARAERARATPRARRTRARREHGGCGERAFVERVKLFPGKLDGTVRRCDRRVASRGQGYSRARDRANEVGADVFSRVGTAGRVRGPPRVARRRGAPPRSRLSDVSSRPVFARRCVRDRRRRLLPPPSPGTAAIASCTSATSTFSRLPTTSGPVSSVSSAPSRPPRRPWRCPAGAIFCVRTAPPNRESAATRASAIADSPSCSSTPSTPVARRRSSSTAPSSRDARCAPARACRPNRWKPPRAKPRWRRTRTRTRTRAAPRARTERRAHNRRQKRRKKHVKTPPWNTRWTVCDSRIPSGKPRTPKTQSRVLTTDDETGARVVGRRRVARRLGRAVQPLVRRHRGGGVGRDGLGLVPSLGGSPPGRIAAAAAARGA